jgi:hypothetical protein
MTTGGEIPDRITCATNGSLKVDNEQYTDDVLVRKELEYLVNARDDADYLTTILNKLRSDDPNVKSSSVGRNYTIGLALSGGGIRSAIVSLGVMQRLAKTGLLRQVDYLSTVSGGGFIGSALSWWMHNSALNVPGTANFDLGDNFPFGTEPPESAAGIEPPALKFMRENGRYLVPGNGHGVAAGIAVVLRAAFLNLLVLIPIVALTLMIVDWIGTWSFVADLPSAMASFAEHPMLVLNSSLGSDVTTGFPPIYLLLLLVTAAVAVLFAIVSVNLSIQSWLERGESSDDAFFSSLIYSWCKSSGLLRPTPVRWLLALIICAVIAVILVLIVGWVVPLAGPVLKTGVLEPEISGNLWLPNLFFGVSVLAFGIVYFAGGSETQLRYRKKFIQMAAVFFAVGILDLGISNFPKLVDQSRLWAVAIAWVWATSAVVVATGYFAVWSFLLGHLVRNVLQTRDTSVRYGARRQFEKVFGAALVLAAACIAIGVLPIIVGRINESVAGGGPTAAISLVLGITSAIWGHYRTYLRGLGGKGTGITLMIGSLLLLYGILILGYMIATAYNEADTAMTRVVILVLITVAAITGWFTNLNYLSLHRFYRDRLAEAFMPDFQTTKLGVNAPADGADKLPIAAPTQPEAISEAFNNSCRKGLYHIVNANVILDRARQIKYRSRGGDNFILSPLYCGSNATGWQKSADFVGGEMTLASAMAISGAAANPRSGFAGTGITRNNLVSLAMSALSLRLGYWVAKPLAKDGSVSSGTKIVRRANHFFPSAWYAISKRGYSENSNFLELSDGGHFENLGVYELVRRRCGLIIICDGGQDPDSSYQSLTYAALRVKEDFGAVIKFNVELNEGTEKDPNYKLTSPAELVARPTNNEFPKGAEFATRGFFLASVDYGERGGGAWPKQGLIIYLKSAMIKDLGLVARGYKGAHPEFPYQSTSDQFFEPEQFEAYREVGHKICEQMLTQTRLLDLFDASNSTVVRPPIGRLQDGLPDPIVIGD